MPLTLYKFDASPPSRAVQMTVALLGLQVENKITSTVAKDNFKPEYLSKNPLHSVPFLEDGDFHLADSHAIITYLVTKYGAEKREALYPGDHRLRATVDQRLYFEASALFPRMRSATKRLLVNNQVGITKEHASDIIDAYNVLEAYLNKNEYVACDRLTVADISCIAEVSSLNSWVPLGGKFPKIQAWWDRLKTEEWYIKENEPGLKIYDGFVKKFNNGQTPVVLDD